MSHTMLYKAPGPHDIHGGKFDYTVVEDEAVEAALADGWHRSTTDASAAHAAKLAEQAKAAAETAESEALAKAKALVEANKAPTRAELEAKATELGLKFDGRTTDKKLGEMIDAKLAEQAK